MASTLTQEEWLDRYDLLDDDWYYNPPAADEGSGALDGDLHSEL